MLRRSIKVGQVSLISLYKTSFALIDTDFSFPVAYTVTLTTAEPLPTNKALVATSTCISTIISSSTSTKPNKASSTSPSSITLGDQQCLDIARDESQYLEVLGPVDLETQEYFAETICQEITQNHIQLNNSGDDTRTHHLFYIKFINNTSYNYGIEWIRGCEQKPTLIPADRPLPGSDINCSTLWIGDCTACR